MTNLIVNSLFDARLCHKQWVNIFYGLDNQFVPISYWLVWLFTSWRNDIRITVGYVSSDGRFISGQWSSKHFDHHDLSGPDDRLVSNVYLCGGGGISLLWSPICHVVECCIIDPSLYINITRCDYINILHAFYVQKSVPFLVKHAVHNTLHLRARDYCAKTRWNFVVSNLL